MVTHSLLESYWCLTFDNVCQSRLAPCRHVLKGIRHCPGDSLARDGAIYRAEACRGWHAVRNANWCMSHCYEAA